MAELGLLADCLDNLIDSVGTNAVAAVLTVFLVISVRGELVRGNPQYTGSMEVVFIF